MTASPQIPSMTNDQLRQMCEDDLFIFAKWCLGFDWLDKEIHGPLCDILQDFENRRREVIVLPRGWLKTTLCSQAYPMWRAVKAKGNIRILLIQNTYDNAIAKLSVIRNQWEKNEILRLLWSDLIPGKNSTWKGDSLCLSRSKDFPESTFEGGGTRSQFTSRHYDIIIEDDTVSPKLNEFGEENVAPIKEDIDQAIGFHQSCVDLLNNPPKDDKDALPTQRLVVGTRWFEKDLISWIDEVENKRGPVPIYSFYRRACLENKDGEADEQGNPTYPARFDKDVLQTLKAEKGEYMFSCLYLNKPIRSENMLFKPSWFKYYEEPPLNLLHYTTVDPGGDPELTKGEPDWNVVMTCGVDVNTGRKYVLHYDRAKCSMSELIELIFNHYDLYQPQKIGVEAIQYQKAIIHVLRQEMRKREKYLNVVPISHGKKPKAFRIKALQPGVENGTILFRSHHSALITEATVFPYGKHDDLIDCLSMQLTLWALLRIAYEPKQDDEPAPYTLAGVLQKVNKEREKAARRRRVMNASGIGPVDSRRIRMTSRARLVVA